MVNRRSLLAQCAKVVWRRGWFFIGTGVVGVVFLRVCVILSLLLGFASVGTAAGVPATLAGFDGQWQLVDDDSDDIMKLWHEAVREKMKRDMRRVSSNTPMALPANPGQHINLPWFLGSFKRVILSTTPQHVVIEQRQFRQPEIRKRDRSKVVAPEVISREVNLHPEATSISLREAAKRPPTMFVGGWEKDALVIETTTDEGLLIEERWRLTREDKEQILHREVRLRSSIWGEKTFEQQFSRTAS
jgi:hypothetical protein